MKHMQGRGSGDAALREEGTVTVSRSPAASRRILGSQLRTLREAAGKKIEDAAGRLEYSTATISRLETGKGKPRTRDVKDLIAFYGGTDTDLYERLLDLASDAQEQDWLSDFRDVIRGNLFGDHLVRFVELERDASELKMFEADLIPGILQSEEYVDAVYRAVFPDADTAERGRLVDFRRKRQEILRLPEPPTLCVIVSELAVIRPISDTGVKRRQLEALYTDLGGPLKNVDFRILPLTSPEPGALGGPFAIIKFPDEGQNVVYLEGREGATYLETKEGVDRYEGKFQALERASLDRDASLQRLATEIENTPAT